MSSVSESKARTSVTTAIANQLRIALRQQDDPQHPGKLRVSEVSVKIFDGLLSNEEALDGLRQLLKIKPKNDGKWLSTEQAAERMGFSRPYVVALLDSKDFEGKWIRSGTAGHRRVLASAVDDWMRTHGVRNPLSDEDLAILRAPDDPEFFDDGPALTSEQESVRMAEILAVRATAVKSRPRRR